MVLFLFIAGFNTSFCIKHEETHILYLVFLTTVQLFYLKFGKNIGAFYSIISFYSLSAGLGRTGTYIAIDTLGETLRKREAKINIADFVKKMRKDRMNMVQTYVSLSIETPHVLVLWNYLRLQRDRHMM